MHNIAAQAGMNNSMHYHVVCGYLGLIYYVSTTYKNQEW